MPAKRAKGVVRMEILVTPEELAHIDQCSKLAKVKRVEFIRRLAKRAYADAVRCNLIKEVPGEQSHQVH